MQTYTFPVPPSEPVLSPVEEEAESAAFVAHIEAVAANGGGVLTVPQEANRRLTTSALSDFWTVVAARLPEGWTLEESGLPDLFGTRFLRHGAPKQEERAPVPKLASVVTVRQDSDKEPASPPPAPDGYEWQWLEMQVIAYPNDTGGTDREAWHTFELVRSACP